MIYIILFIYYLFIYKFNDVVKSFIAGNNSISVASNNTRLEGFHKLGKVRISEHNKVFVVINKAYKLRKRVNSRSFNLMRVSRISKAASHSDKEASFERLPSSTPQQRPSDVPKQFYAHISVLGVAGLCALLEEPQELGPLTSGYSDLRNGADNVCSTVAQHWRRVCCHVL